MASRTTIGAFSVPSPPGCMPPSVLEAEVVRLSRVASILCGAVVVSLVGTAWLAYAAVHRADVIPYVADGGVFGCAVQVLPTPAGEARS